jgi:hypothetical protein
MQSARFFRAFLVLTGLAVSCFAQVGLPPVPVPGTPPIGHNPKDDEQTIQRPGKKKKTKGTPKEEQPRIDFEGTTLENNGKEIVVHTADGRWITMTIDQDTKWSKDGAPIDAAKIVRGTTVKAEAAVDDEAYLTAVTIELKKDATPEQKAEATAKPSVDAQPDDEQLVEAKKPLDMPDAPDRPKLTRAHTVKSGVQSIHGSDGTEADTEQTAQPTVSKPKAAADDQPQDFSIGLDTPMKSASKGGPGSEVLQRSSSWVETFDQGLPNYLCREVTTRYIQSTRGGDWNPQDVVTANIVYQDGREEQRDVMVGNKKVSDISKTGGTWSTGEFATMLHSLFQPTRETDFKYDHAGVIHDVPTAEFNYDVALPNSDWSIIVGGQILRPKYTGTLWIEKNTGIVRRLEQEAKNIPKDFPLDEVQEAIEYEEVSLGAARKFLLPVRAENISCQRATTTCTKNVIEFRDYHKFSGESTIEFGK